MEKLSSDTLLLKRFLGSAVPDDYIAWAEQRLVAGEDSPSLRVLAGLDPRFERHEVEAYFLRTVQELGLQLPCEGDDLMKAARIVRRSYDQREMDGAEALRTMAALYEKSDYTHPLLWIWYEIDEELSLQGSGYEGCFYPAEALAAPGTVFEREWTLLEQACRLDLQEGFYSFIRCDRCGRIGAPRFRRKGLSARIKACLPWLRPKPPLWPTCAACGSFDYHGMAYPEVREAYFESLEGP